MTSHIKMPEEYTANIMSSAVTSLDHWMNHCSYSSGYFSETPVNALGDTHDELANSIVEPPVSYFVHDYTHCNLQLSRNVSENSFNWTPYPSDIHQQFQKDNHHSSNICSNEPLITYQSDHYPRSSQVALQALPPPSLHNDSPHFLAGPSVSTYSGHRERFESPLSDVPSAPFGNVNQCAPSWQINQYEACLDATSLKLQVQQDSSQLHFHVNQDECQSAQSSLHEPIDYQSEFYENYECTNGDLLGFQESDHTRGLQFERREDSTGVATTSQLEMLARNQKTENQLQCEVCHRKFLFPYDLKKHRRTHTGEKPYQCNLCLRKFTLRSSLMRHQLIHIREKSYPCDLCPRQFSRRYNLKKHLQTHAEEKLFKCDLCPRKFLHHNVLIQHERIHIEEKPYKCDLCASKFLRPSELKIHRRIHTGEKPYQCGLCPKTFSQLNNLTTHRRVHTGEKPYQCDLCLKKFSHKVKMQVHRWNHTAVKPH